MTGPKILTLDIETSPALVWTFELRNVNIGAHQIEQPTRMLSFAAKWLDDKRVIYFSEFHDGRDTMIRAVHALLDAADVVVTYNGDNFDLPHISREIDLFNLEQTDPDLRLLEPSPFVSVDLYKVVKKHQKWLSHKLSYITESLGMTGKLQHYGFELWLDCMRGVAKAWNVFRRYNKQDVVTTEELLLHCWSKITNMPSPALFEEEPELQPLTCICGSQNVHRRGWARTKTRRYPRFQCQDCGKWSRDTRSDRGRSVRLT